jgi:hypothetical protein
VRTIAAASLEVPLVLIKASRSGIKFLRVRTNWPGGSCKAIECTHDPVGLEPAEARPPLGRVRWKSPVTAGVRRLQVTVTIGCGATLISTPKYPC